MTKKQRMRIRIAQDALAWLRAGALRASHWCFFLPATFEGREALTSATDGKQLRDVVLGPCNVCALGALFVSHVVSFNHRLAKDSWGIDRWEIHEQLKDHFSSEELSCIEVAFEGWGSASSRYSQSYLFYRRYPNSTERLEAILENIIKNEGEFIP